jgi:CheY-like chemotaxis protein
MTSNLLLVDDDLGTRETFSLLLSQHGLHVTSVCSGEDALNAALAGLVDVIVTDLRLPGISGIELLQTLRSARVYAPLIVMTGFATIHSAVEATRLGAVDYLEKPIGEEALISAIQDALQVQRDLLVARSGEMPGATRWAAAVLSLLTSASDPNTLAEWERCAHLSRQALENRCQAVGVTAKRSLDFGRVLRAVMLAGQMQCAAIDLLNGDYRTLRRLLAQVGVSRHDLRRTHLRLDGFLASQRFIVEPVLLRAVSVALNDPRVFPQPPGH